MTRYHVRDLGRGLLEPGGLNLDGAVVFTEVVEDRWPGAVTALSSVAGPTAPVVRALGPGEANAPPSIIGALAGGIDRTGAVVGAVVLGPGHGTAVATVAVSVEAGAIRARHAPVSGFDASLARAIAPDGAVIGDSLRADTSAATAWRDGQATRLDAGLPGATFSRALAVNRRGTVLGVFGMPGGAPGSVRGWLRDANQGLEVDVGPTGLDAFPADLNDAGRVVGVASDQRGWYAQRSGSARRLALLAGTVVSAAHGVNNAGTIVGSCDGRACLWEDPEDPLRAPVDLNACARVPDGGRLHRATRINDAGLILCAGSSDRGPDRVYLLSPHGGGAPRADDVPDEILLGLDPRAAVFGIRLCPSSDDGDPPRGRVSLSMLCRLVSALDCPSCLTLGEAPCGGGWGIGVEGVPDGVRVTLLEGGHRVGELAAGPPRGDGAPFASRAGQRSLEIIFAPRGPNEHILLFEGDPVVGRAGEGVIFPIRLTIFRGDAAAG